MHQSGYSLHGIASVTKHKNTESLKFYLEQLTLDDMENYSDSLFKYTGPTNDSDDDFEPNPPRQKKKYTTTSTSTSIPQKDQQNDTTLAVLKSTQENINHSSNMTMTMPNNTSNFMAMYRQNPVGMFMGANI